MLNWQCKRIPHSLLQGASIQLGDEDLHKKGGITVKSQQEVGNPSAVLSDTRTGTKLALWWLRHYESITEFWRGFSWIWVITVLFHVLAGYLDLARAIGLIFVVGIIANSGVYLAIKAIGSHLKHLEDGPEKEEAHDLMIEIIKRRALIGVCKRTSSRFSG